MVSFISLAVSPLPSPFLPWHISQSSVHHLLARARDSGVAFTGFGCLAASTGMATTDGVFCVAGADDCCWASADKDTSKSAGRTNARRDMEPPLGNRVANKEIVLQNPGGSCD